MYENVTFESILERMLERVPDTMDKREGSVVYDALAPAAIELQLMYIELDNTLNECFADTATRDYLIKRAAERGLKPYAAKPAVLEGSFAPSSLDVSVGSRFNLGELNYKLIQKISAGKYELECETPGVIGNVTGTLIPIEELTGLETAEATAILIPGENEEETETFRQRYHESFDMQSYGGNIADYKSKINALNGVGDCKVYPIWNGGGTVKIVILDSSYNKPSTSLIDSVQSAVDPVVNQGEGYGIAPIGHIVTIESVDGVLINVTTDFVFEEGYSIESAIESLQTAIDKYFLALKKEWSASEHLVVRISQIEYNLLECAEVLDVSNTLINGVASNMILESAETPERGTINGL